MEGNSCFFTGNHFINNIKDKIVSDLLLGFCYCLFVLGLGFVSDFAVVNSFDLISSNGAANRRNSSSSLLVETRDRSEGNSPFYPRTPNDLPTLIKDALTGSLLGDGYLGFANKLNGLGQGNASAPRLICFNSKKF